MANRNKTLASVSRFHSLSTRLGKDRPPDGGCFRLERLNCKHLKSYVDCMQTEDTKMKNLDVVFNGIAVAMGIAIIVLNIVNPLSLTGATTLLGIGVAALGIANLRKA